MQNVVFNPDEYIENGGIIEDAEFKEIKEEKSKKGKIDLREQKRYGLLLLFVSCGIMLLGKIVPEVLFWALILGSLGIVAIVSKNKIIH